MAFTCREEATRGTWGARQGYSSWLPALKSTQYVLTVPWRRIEAYAPQKPYLVWEIPHPEPYGTSAA
jgi:hypothetical protein